MLLTSKQICDNFDVDVPEAMYNMQARQLVKQHKLDLSYYNGYFFQPEDFSIDLLTQTFTPEERQVYNAQVATDLGVYKYLASNGVASMLYDLLNPQGTGEGWEAYESHELFMDYARHCVKVEMVAKVLDKQTKAKQRQDQHNKMVADHSCPICGEWALSTKYSNTRPCPKCQWIINNRLLADRSKLVDKWLARNKGEVKLDL